MQIIDYSPLRNEGNSISIPDLLRGIWEYDLSWYRDLKAQDILLANLKKNLGDDFYLVRSLTWPGIGFPIPMVLIGPPGVQVI